jgi:hypothetical protein
LQIQRVRTIGLVVAPSKSKHLIEPSGRLAIRPKAKLVECVAGRPDDRVDEQSADASAAKGHRNIEVADATDSPVATVRVDVEPANTDDAAASNRCEESLASLRKAVRLTLPVPDQPGQKAEAGFLALRDKVRQPVGR